MILNTLCPILLAALPLTYAACASSNCAGHYVIEHSNHKRLNITGKTYNGFITSLSKTVTGYILTRRRYWNYEYEGGAADGNSGCRPIYDYPKITLDDAEDWVRNSHCCHGTICSPDGDCWGGSANQCLDKGRDAINVCVESRKEAYFGRCWYKWPYHTCVLDWACENKKFDFPIHLTEKMEIATSLPNGTKINLATETPLTDLGKGSYLYIRPQDLSKGRNDDRCFLKCIETEQVEKTVCVTGDNCKNPHIPLRYVSKDLFCSRSLCAKRREQLSAVAVDEDVDKPASINDLLSQKTYFQAEVDRIDLNSANLIMHIDQLETLFLNLISHIAKTDQLLVGAVIKKDFMTRFMTEEQFTICPCESEKPHYDLICNQKSETSYTYNNGEYVPWNKKDQCFKPIISGNTSRIKTLKLLSDFDITPDDFTPPDIVGAAFQWQGWQWLNEYRDDIIWSISKTKETDTSGFFEHIDSPLFHIGNLLFTYISSYISYIALIVSIIALCKR